jgi:hypothetical protein
MYAQQEHEAIKVNAENYDFNLETITPDHFKD